MFLPKDKIRFTVQTFLKLSSDEDSLRKSVSELQCSYCLDLLSFFSDHGTIHYEQGQEVILYHIAAVSLILEDPILLQCNPK